MNANSQVVIYADGACAPCNPGGYATYGWVAQVDGRIIERGMGCVAKGSGATNNVAEFAAVIAALTWAEMQGLREILLYTDSQLVINLCSGEWKCRKPHLQPLRNEAQALLKSVRGKIKWVSREENSAADALSKQAYKKALADPTWTTDRAVPADVQPCAVVPSASIPDPDSPDISCPRCHIQFRLLAATWKGLLPQTDCSFCPYCGGQMSDLD